MKTHRLALRSDDFLVCHMPPPERPPSGGLWECLATHGQQQRLTCLLGFPCCIRVLILIPAFSYEARRCFPSIPLGPRAS